MPLEWEEPCYYADIVGPFLHLLKTPPAWIIAKG